MKDEELKQLIHNLRIKFGTEELMKKKLCLILGELLTRYEELDERFVDLHQAGKHL